MEQQKNNRAMVVGSARQHESSVVVGAISALVEALDVGTVITGISPGVDDAARSAAELCGVSCMIHNLPPEQLDKLEHVMFNSGVFPERLLRADPMFCDLVKRVVDFGVNVAIVIPNPEGQLGRSTAIMKKIFDAAGCQVIDATESMQFAASIEQRISSAGQSNTAAGLAKAA